MKKVISLLMAMVLSLAVLPVAASAAETFDESKLNWLGPAISIDEEGNVTISPDVTEQDIADICMNNFDEYGVHFKEEDFKTIICYVSTYHPTSITSYTLCWVIEDCGMLVIHPDGKIRLYTGAWSVAFTSDLSEVTYKFFGTLK